MNFCYADPVIPDSSVGGPVIREEVPFAQRLWAWWLIGRADASPSLAVACGTSA